MFTLKALYAHIEVLVTFLLVNLFDFLVIKSSHGSYKGRHLVEILPTDLPGLFKPCGKLKNLKKLTTLEFWYSLIFSLVNL